MVVTHQYPRIEIWYQLHLSVRSGSLVAEADIEEYWQALQLAEGPARRLINDGIFVLWIIRGAAPPQKPPASLVFAASVKNTKTDGLPGSRADDGPDWTELNIN